MVKRSRKLTPCRFLTNRESKSEPPENELWMDVSSSGEPPFNQLGPFYPHGGIPVPGCPGVVSDSVEGIWQGLKVIRGKTAPRFFVGSGRKRGGGKPAGHQLGDGTRLLGLAEARQKIYIPTYRWMLENKADPGVIKQLVDNCFRGILQRLYDREDNGSIHVDQPLSHAKVLVDFINERCQAMLQAEAENEDEPT